MKQHRTPCGQAHRPPRSRLRGRGLTLALAAAGALALPAGFIPFAAADDTDIWKPPAKNNAYLMLDTSSSMTRTVYERRVDYAAYYDWLMTLHDDTPMSTRQRNDDPYYGNPYSVKGKYIFDSGRGSQVIAHGVHYERDRIYLVNGYEKNSFVAMEQDGKKVMYVADPGYKEWSIWDTNKVDKPYKVENGKQDSEQWKKALIAIDTKTLLSKKKVGDQYVFELEFEPGSLLSLGDVDPKTGYKQVLFQDEILPWGADLTEHEHLTLKNGTQIDIGFVGSLLAPGYAYSGYVSAPAQGTMVPYTGKASDKSLAATDKAREMLLGDRASMQNWTKTQWQAWADARFTADTSPDGTTWRDWTGARTKNSSDHTVFWDYRNATDEAIATLGREATGWTAAAWRKFIAEIDYYWQTGGNRYFCVLLPSNKGGQQRGEFLLGRWAKAMYDKNLPERQTWDKTYNSSKWGKATGSGNTGYFFATGNFLNFIQCQTLRYIKTPGLDKSLYPKKQDGKDGRKDYMMYDRQWAWDMYPLPEPITDGYDENGTSLGKGSGPRVNPCYYEDYKYTDDEGNERVYRLQSRMEVAREAIKYVIEKYSDRMNWGFASFPVWHDGIMNENWTQYNSQLSNGNINGADSRTFVPLNPNGKVEEQREAIIEQIMAIVPYGGTPLMATLSGTWHKGFYEQRATLADEKSCAKNYVISLTDGVPSSWDTNHSNPQKKCLFSINGREGGACNNWENGGGKTPVIPSNAAIHPKKAPSYAKCSKNVVNGGFQNWDCDSWLTEPTSGTQYPSLYDDVSEYMYTHDFATGEEIPEEERADSKRNVRSHHIGFASKQGLLQDAAKSAGGDYAVVSNKEQLVAVLEALALSISEAASFTAPSVPADAANSLESGEDSYMGLFMPLAEAPWAGNVKWYKRGSSDPDSLAYQKGAKNPYAFYGKDYTAATKDGEFISGVTDWWGDADFNSEATDTNITDDGAGEVLLQAIKEHFAAGDYYKRNIYTCRPDDDDDDTDDIDVDECEMVEFTRDTITNEDLHVDSDEERYSVINFTYGYTYEAEANGDPKAVRDWPLGAIIHSQPIAIDYYANAEVDEPYHRLIAVGANDGMLHVFDANSGEELFAFIPADILPKLKDMRKPGIVYSVDGELTLYRAGDPPRQPKYLIFGERRGGGKYWCLDIEMDKDKQWTSKPWDPVGDEADDPNWEVEWVFGHTEIAQSWSKVQTARIPVKLEKKAGKNKAGEDVTIDARTYEDVVIFTAGYDPVEDSFPEPFNDRGGPEAEQNTGTPFALNTDAKAATTKDALIPAKWCPADSTATECDKTKWDPNGNDKYDIQNPGDVTKGKGRAIFVRAIDDPKKEIKATYHKYDIAAGKYADTATEEVVLPFTLTYGADDDAGNGRSRSDMIYSFPATPSTVAYTDAFMDQAKGQVDTRTNVLDTVYAPDIYGNLFKARYNIAFENFGTIDEPDWRLRGEGWEVAKVFTANPGSAGMPAGVEGAQVAADVGRKVFYPPTVSWGGTEGFFEAANFDFYDDEAHTAEDFRNRNGIATVFFGTGDREHPTYTMVHNRIYSVYDDSSMYVRKNGAKHNISSVSSSVSYDERDLLNLTCDELGSEFKAPSYLWSDTNADTRDDFNSWLKATFKRDWNGDGKVDANDAPGGVSDVQTQLTDAAGAFHNDFCDWVEERTPWKYAGTSGQTQLTTDCTGAAADSLAKEYLAKLYLGETLTDDARDNYDEKLAALELGGARNSSGKRVGTENDRKGWFIKLDEQNGAYCGHMQYGSNYAQDDSKNNHRGEQVLAPLTLYYGTLYLTSYQSDLSDPCKTGSNAFTYAIDYQSAKAPYNYDVTDSDLNMTDRSFKYEGILGLPSGVTFIFDGDKVVPVAQLGGNELAGFAEALPPGTECAGDECKSKPGLDGVSSPSPGLELFYWRDSNSQSPDDLNGIEADGGNGGGTGTGGGDGNP